MFELIQQLTGKSVNEGNMGMATGYLVDLKKQTAVDLQTDTAANLKARTVYNEEMLLSMQANAQHNFIKMAQEKIQMPTGMGGLMRYSEEYKSSLMFKPGTVIFLIVLVMIIEFVLHKFGAGWFGVPLS
jgi:preprotein translocase subunit Sec61beta